MLKVLLEAERCAVRGYTHICNVTAGKDHRTYDLALAILNEEIEHEAWFAEFLGEGPSGHFARKAVASLRSSPSFSIPSISAVRTAEGAGARTGLRAGGTPAPSAWELRNG